MNTEVDVLCVGAHPDDVEVGIGGLVHKLVRAGHTIGILDLTRGELGTRGSIEERAEEAQDAARILGVSFRENVGLPDGAIANTRESQGLVIPFLRRFRPKVLIAPHEPDRHPDHSAAHRLIADANYFSGLAKLRCEGAPYRCPRVYFYRVYGESVQPQMLFDITQEFPVKLRALQAFRSQFFNPQYEGAPTYVASEAFWESIQSRAAYWGSRAGVAFAEPLYALEPVILAVPPGLEGVA
ncbi:MAG: bacillithiol biosynthesis deacetylase BshB1 [Candidatus Hydrogenedentes bacterium]|nr:bacillithiol biosynthesis deacetylase BshB1 [Candidatus Hydrogenedentota bacterium]